MQRIIVTTFEYAEDKIEGYLSSGWKVIHTATQHVSTANPHNREMEGKVLFILEK